MTKPILIVGGYGDVGGHLGAELVAANYPPIRVAGRSEDKARQMASSLGSNAEWGRVDVNNAASVHAALDEVSGVVSCIDQEEPHLLKAALAKGLPYVDVTAGRDFIETGLALAGEAKRTGARVLLGSGLTPGLINVMAKVCSERAGGAHEIHTHGLFSAGDAYGMAALRFMLQMIPKPYVIREHGVPRTVWCFGEHKQVTFPAPAGKRRVYHFAYPDQFFYPRTLGAETSVSWFALDPPWVTRTQALFVRLVGRRVLRSEAMRERCLKIFNAAGSRYAGQDALMFRVEAHGPKGAANAHVSGRGEGKGTAISTALMLREVLDDSQRMPAGVWLPEQVINTERYLPAMAARGWRVEMN